MSFTALNYDHGKHRTLLESLSLLRDWRNVIFFRCKLIATLHASDGTENKLQKGWQFKIWALLLAF